MKYQTKYMVSLLTEGGKFDGQPTLGTFNKAFGLYQSDKAARRYLLPLIDGKHFAPGRYGLYRGPSVSTDGQLIQWVTK